MDRTRRLAVIGGAVAVITIAHYVTPIEAGFFHNVYQRLYYLPILGAAYWFGVRGAVIVAVLSAASYLPHIVTDWATRPVYRQAQYAELLMFQVVALVVGTLAELEKRQRRELAEALEKLQTSFEQLRRADRLSALGQLSAGLAHEIKNPLASMKGSIDILLDDFPEGHEKREFIQIFKKEIDRLNVVLTEFLQFARPPRPDPQPCDVSEVIDSLRLLCSNEAERCRVELDVRVAVDLPSISADPAQVQQALLNIVLNGIQSMPSGGRLGLTARSNGGGIEIAIDDEGPGIADDELDRIFDPFYTTKDKGTGLGLPIADQLVRGHGGEIRVERLEPGTRFVVTLPAREAGA